LRGKAATFVRAKRTLLRAFAQRSGVYLALAALMLQFALSFGHIHAHDIFGPNATYSSFRAAAGWHKPTKLEASRQHPRKIADDDDQCPICFSTFLIGTSSVPDAPQPLLPPQFAEIDRLVATAFNGLVQSQRGPFQSRAPPLAG
jgi:Protein of unknown function (DUF2946)